MEINVVKILLNTSHIYHAKSHYAKSLRPEQFYLTYKLFMLQGKGKIKFLGTRMLIFLLCFFNWNCLNDFRDRLLPSTFWVLFFISSPSSREACQLWPTLIVLCYPQQSMSLMSMLTKGKQIYLVLVLRPKVIFVKSWGYSALSSPEQPIINVGIRAVSPRDAGSVDWRLPFPNFKKIFQVSLVHKKTSK